MIILDTNVISELLEASPNSNVLAWIDALHTEDLAITSTTAAEMRLGVALMPDGRRKAELHQDVERLIDIDFAGQVWPFDVACTSHYAELRSERRRLGRPMSIGDAQIAAISLQYGAVLATRNVKDFVGTGVETANPWTD